MSGFLFGLGVLGWVIGGGLFAMGTTSIHQALGALIAVSGSVLFAGGAIVGAIQEAQTTLETRILVALREFKGEKPAEPTEQS